jgi:flagellum-specific ATP synthase
MSRTRSLDYLSTPLRRARSSARVGRVRELGARTAIVTGLSDVASLGHRLRFAAGGNVVHGEVVGLTPTDTVVMMEHSADWLRIDHPAVHLGPFRLYPDESWLGRIIDSEGRAVDGGGLLQGPKGIGLENAPPPATSRRAMGGGLATGYAVFDSVLPIVRGQRIGLFSGSGVGKSSLMAAFARDLEADVVVIGMIGERGREVREFVERVLGRKGLARSVVVAATSDQSALARRRAAFTAMAVAEHFRDAGQHVLLMIDSVTRLAEAHREIASVSGEPAAMRGHPPSLMPLLAGFAERAGPGSDAQGDITAVMTVLVSGSDMDEPVADILRGLLDGHFVLSRTIAERGRFPAIDVLQSVSRALPHAATSSENELVQRVRRSLSLFEESEIMVRAGLHHPGADDDLDTAIRLFPRLDAFCSERNAGERRAAFERIAEIFDGQAARAPSPGPVQD